MIESNQHFSTNAAMETNSAWTNGDLPPSFMPSEKAKINTALQIL